MIDGALASVGTTYDIVPIDKSFPLYVQRHQDALSSHILPLPEDDDDASN